MLEHVALFLMYFGGPFMSNPLKPFLQVAVGSEYSRAYRHFRSAHSMNLNVAVHLVCLLQALMANFALLTKGDKMLTPYVKATQLEEIHEEYGLLAASTTILWSLLLLSTNSPLLVRLIVTAVMGGAYYLREEWEPMVNEIMVAEGVIYSLCVKFGDAKVVPIATGPPFWFVLASRYGFHALLYTRCLGALVPWQAEVIGTMAVLLAYGCVNPFQKQGWRPNCYWAGYLGWILALLTGQNWLFFYGSGYIASLCQGVAHEYTGEAANLPELALRTTKDKVADEHAHTSFFPVLIVHAAYENIFGPKKTKTKGQRIQCKRVLVTGCAGRIGRAVTEHLVEQGIRVRGFDRQPQPRSLCANVSKDKFEYFRGDLGKVSDLKKALEGCDCVCHLAAVPDDADFEKVLCPVNIVGFNRVLEVCRGAGIKRLVVASSGKIFYHRNDNYPIRLEDPPKITCNYGATKLYLEGAAEVFAKDPSGCSTVVLRFAWCPFAKPDVEAMASVTAPGQGRDEYMSPKDCSRCVEAALCTDLGNDNFLKLFCQSKPPTGRPARFDLAPTKKALGWSPQDTYPTGIDWILNQTDYVKNPDLKKRIVPGKAEAEAAKRQKVA